MLWESCTFDRWYIDPGSFGNGRVSLAPVVVDLDVALFDVDVRRAVLAHRAELHEVRVGREVAHRVDHVQRVHDVVRLGEDRVLAVLHGVGRARHLAVVHDRLGPELAEERLGHRPVGEVALGEADLVAGDVLPGGDALGQARRDRREGVGARPPGVRCVAGSCRPRAPRGRGWRTASRWATRGSRRRPGSGCACRSFRREPCGKSPDRTNRPPGAKALPTGSPQVSRGQARSASASSTRSTSSSEW